MPKTMLAVVKPEAAPGAEIREVNIPSYGRTDVLVKVKVASICGTDLHIYEWDPWAQGRIHPPLIPGHEFCGEVAAFGDEVTSVKEGDFVSAEMHVACGKCLQCRTGEAHICQNVKIIGVDTDGAFAEYVVIPESNIWKLDPAIPQEYASILDPLGNAVHTVLGRRNRRQDRGHHRLRPHRPVLHRRRASRRRNHQSSPSKSTNTAASSHAKMNADLRPRPRQRGRARHRRRKNRRPRRRRDARNGRPTRRHPPRLRHRPPRRTHLAARPHLEPIPLNFSEDIIFKGITVQGINGRRMYQTWYQMTALLKSGRLDLHPVITDRIPMKDFSQAMARLKTGEASKILVYPNGTK